MPAKYWNILAAVRSSLQGIIGAPPNVAIRRKLIGLKVDKTPAWVVSPGRGGEKIAFQTFRGTSFKTGVIYEYPVAVAMIYGGNEIIGGPGLEAFLNIREVVRDTLFQVATAIQAGGWDINIEPDEVSELGAFMGSNYEVGGMTIRYKFDEQMLG